MTQAGSPHPAPPQDPLWVTSQFSDKDLDGKHVKITWLRGEERLSSEVWVLRAELFGHSHHIQHLRAEPLVRHPEERVSFEFDQEDADQLHRTNENPPAFAFAANLQRDRKRRQNETLARLVQERRLRKQEHGSEWVHAPVAVLTPTEETVAKCVLSEELKDGGPRDETAAEEKPSPPSGPAAWEHLPAQTLP